MLAVIVDWNTPLAIVILEHQLIIEADPGAPFFCFIVVRRNASLKYSSTKLLYLL